MNGSGHISVPRRTTGWAGLVAGLVLGLVLVTTPSAGAAAAALSPAAQQALVEGSAAYRRGQASSNPADFLAAIALFQRARVESSNAPEALFYLGAGEANIPGRELRAIAWYGAYLSVRPDAPNADKVQAEITRLRLVHHDILLAVIGEVEKAARFAERPGPSLREVVRCLADLGDLASARRLAGSLTEYPVAQAEAYDWIAKAQSEAGDLDGAFATMAVVDDKQPDKSDTFAIIAERWIPRDPAAVRRMMTQLPNARTKDRVLSQVAIFQVRTGQTAAALETAATILDEEIRNNTRENIAGRLVHEFGDVAAAAAILPLFPDNNYEQNAVRSIISRAQAEKGDFAAALRTATPNTPPDGNTSQMYVEIALRQAESGDVSGTLRTVALILPDRRDQARSLAQVALAKGLWKRGDGAEARRIVAAARQSAQLVRDNEQRDIFWRSLALLEGENKDMAEALTDAARIQGEYWKAETQQDLAELQAERGDIAGAIQTAAGIQYQDPTMMRNYALQAVAGIQAKQGDVTGSLRTAEMLTGERSKDALRHAVADIQAKAGDLVAAQKTIATIRDSYEQRLALESVDEVLTKNGDQLTRWLQRLEDANLDHDGALNAGLFLDQSGYLRSLAASEDPKQLFSAYYRAYIDLGDAEKIILQMLQPQPAP